jgi:glycosyltransferase involved in cell wall biosynthesis
MTPKLKVMLLQTRHIESISYLVAELVKALPQERYEVTLVYLESGELSDSDRLAQDCVFLGLSKLDYKGLRLKAIGKLKDFLRERHFDIIIANMYKPINLLMQLGRSLEAQLCIGIIHAFGEFDRLGRRLMMRWLLDSRWRIVGVSQPLCDYLIAANCGMNSKNTFAINNAVDLSATGLQALDAISARAALKLPQQGMIYGTLGRSVKGKRQLELIKAFYQFLKKHHFLDDHQKSYLVIIGDGEQHKELRDYVALHQLEDSIYLVGHVPSAFRYLRAFDVFVFPSESEGFGLALLEAMALSLPTIVNQIEPLKSLVASTNLIVDSANVSAMADALECYHQLSKEQLRQKGADNYLRVYQYYNVDVYRKAYLNLIDSTYANLTRKIK